MYRRLLQLISGCCLLFTFWPALRFDNVTIFDWLAPVAILCALPYQPAERGPGLGSLKLAIAGVALLAFAGIISVGPSYDSVEHVWKVVYLVIAFLAIVGLGYVLVNRKIFSIVQMLLILCCSAMICSAACIAQGRYHLLLNFVTKDEFGPQAWIRMVGLAEHPIETGVVSGFGVIIALGLMMYTRRWLFFVVAIAIDLYSFTYSASLTAVFAILFSAFVMCLYARAYRSLVYGTIIAVAGLWMAFTFSSDAHLLTSRLSAFSATTGNYKTVETRKMQWEKALEMIGPRTLLVGNGYSSLDLPYGLDIHNGVIGAVFHFGLLGLASQVLLIGSFAGRLRSDHPRELKAVLVGCLVIFAFSYMTGPALARRSLWVPLLLLGAYLAPLKNSDSVPARIGALQPVTFK
jgi:hypothetical protein